MAMSIPNIDEYDKVLSVCWYDSEVPNEELMLVLFNG
jgi:hypothetical protein